MVLLQIDPNSVPILELKRDSPRPIYLRRVAQGIGIWMRMGIESASRDLANMISAIQNRKNFKASLAKLSGDRRAPTRLEQLLESLVAETPDHGGSVAARATDVKRRATCERT